MSLDVLTYWLCASVTGALAGGFVSTAFDSSNTAFTTILLIVLMTVSLFLTLCFASAITEEN